MNLKEERKIQDERIEYFLTGDTAQHLINKIDVGVGKTYSTTKKSLEHNYHILYVHDKYEMLDGFYEDLITQLNVNEEDIAYIKSYVKLGKEMQNESNDKQVEEFLKRLIEELTLLEENEEPAYYIQYDKTLIKTKWQKKIVNEISKKFKEQYEDLDNKKIILVTKMKFLSKKFGPNLFGEKKKILIFDEAGIERYTNNELFLNRKNFEFNFEILEKDYDDWIIEDIIGEYDFTIYDFSKYLFKIKEKTEMNYIFKIDKFSCDDIKINKFIDELILFFYSFCRPDDMPNFQLKYFEKVKLLDELYDEFIEYMESFKGELKKSNDSYKNVYKHTMINIKHLKHHKRFLYEFLTHQYTTLKYNFNVEKKKCEWQNFVCPNFLNIQKVNLLSSTFDKVTILDATFDENIFNQIMKYVYDKPRLICKGYGREPFYWKKPVILESNIENKNTYIFNYTKYSNETNDRSFGKSADIVWDDKDFLNGILHMILYFKRVNNKVVAGTHKIKVVEFNDLCETIHYPSDGINKYKDYDVLFIVGMKHFGEEDYYLKYLTYNGNLPKKLQNPIVTKSYVEEHSLYLMTYQMLGRVRPYDKNKIIVYFGRRLTQPVDITKKLNYIYANEIHFAMLPLLAIKLRDSGNELTFDLNNFIDKILYYYFKPIIHYILKQKLNLIRIRRISESFSINKEEFLNMINKLFENKRSMKSLVKAVDIFVVNIYMKQLCQSVVPEFQYLLKSKNKNKFWFVNQD